MCKDPTHCGQCHLYAGGPGWNEEQAEQAMGSKPVSSTPPRPLHEFLPSGSCPA
ncbi:hypothetical protein ACRRTK_019306 [Alexandromys fortis]